MTESLDAIGLRYGTDQSSSFHDFLNRLEPFFAPFSDNSKLVVEIGVAGGNSLKTWHSYFPNAKVLGLDHNEASLECFDVNDFPRMGVILADACDPGIWPTIASSFGKIDVLIDDASHFSSAIITAFNLAWPLIRPGGIYVCQDLHAAGYDAAYNRDGGPTAVEFFKEKVDWCNEFGAGQCGKPQRDTEDIDSITFSKSLCIIKKRL